MSGTNEKFVLSLCTKTWVRDSHGLYDYESTQTRNLNAVLAESIYIARKKHDIKTLSNINDLKTDEEELLFNVVNDNKDEYILENPVPILIQPTEKNINDLSHFPFIFLLSPAKFCIPSMLENSFIIFIIPPAPPI